MEILASRDLITSLEIVEVNPVLDEHNATGSLAVELACSAFGKRISVRLARLRGAPRR